MKAAVPVDETSSLLSATAPPPPYQVIPPRGSDLASDSTSSQQIPIFIHHHVCSAASYPLPRVATSPLHHHRIASGSGPSPFHALPAPIAFAYSHQQALRRADARARRRVMTGFIGALLLWWSISLVFGAVLEHQPELERWGKDRMRDLKRWGREHRWNEEEHRHERGPRWSGFPAERQEGIHAATMQTGPDKTDLPTKLTEPVVVSHPTIEATN